ncbi:hypothetical protein DRN67_01850 [Candidatus Micrarchaeota archaeon]|nr:MAG: hypothetical protein DRN67_01850 [Candidatus Micrarchaeota archaeon]
MIVNAVVKPNSDEFNVEWNDGKLRVRLTEPAENGRANLELVRELAKFFDCPVRLVAGLKSKRKKLDFELCEADFYERLRGLEG